ncbi:MAG: alpha/beta hydrolase-fold protein [Acidobacteriota bacterium]
MNRSWILASVMALIVSGAVADEPPPYSPRLLRLQGEIAEGKAAAIEAFWAERQWASAPLVEPLEGKGAQVLVTFLWRGDPATKNVFVITLDQVQFSNAAYLARGRLARLAGSDVWYRTYRMPCDLRFSYRFSVNDPGTLTPAMSSDETARRTAQLRPDPQNRRHYASRSGDSSVAELPCATPQPDAITQEGIPHGEVTKEIFAGGSGESHALQIYTPPHSNEVRASSLVILIGGEFSADFPVPTMLDNMIARKEIPPTIAVSIGFTDMAAYVNASRSNERFARYVAEELLPWLRGRYSIANNARRVVIAGSSAPGAGALFVAMRHPDAFGGVLTQAGGYSYANPPASDELIPSEQPEGEPLARELAHVDPLPFSVFLAVGTLDDVTYEGKDPFYAHATVLVAARHLRDVLEAKRYNMRYREFGGGHETLAWRGTFGEGLEWLLSLPSLGRD